MKRFLLDAQAVDVAKRALEIVETVYIALQPVPESMESYGYYSCDNQHREHRIVVNTYRGRSAAQRSKTLWHELQHAADAEWTWYEGGDWHKTYSANPEYFEKRARRTERLHDECPLVVLG